MVISEVLSPPSPPLELSLFSDSRYSLQVSTPLKDHVVLTRTGTIGTDARALYLSSLLTAVDHVEGLPVAQISFVNGFLRLIPQDVATVAIQIFDSDGFPFWINGYTYQGRNEDSRDKAYYVAVKGDHTLYSRQEYTQEEAFKLAQASDVGPDGTVSNFEASARERGVRKIFHLRDDAEIQIGKTITGLNALTITHKMLTPFTSPAGITNITGPVILASPTYMNYLT